MSPTHTLPDLIPHGQHINPHYEGGAAGDSTAQDRPEAAMHGMLKRFDKTQSASGTAQAFGWIKAIYPNAIEYAGQKQALEGGIMVGAFFGVPFAIAAFGMMFVTFLVSKTWVLSVGMLVGCAAMFAFGYWSLLFPLRHVWRTPRDLPIIFDRANRKVYRMAQQRVPGLRGLIQPWPVKALAYDWDLVDAEHHSELVGSTNLARRLHRLVFVVRHRADDPTIIDTFEIGNGLAQTEEMVAPMYEHIRRFMQEQGPHLPHPDEPLDERPDDLPSWWQACGRAGPWGNRYLWWWKNDKFMSGLHHVLLAATLFMYWAVWNDAARLGFEGMAGLMEFKWWHWLGGFSFFWISLSMVWGQGTGIWLMAHTSYRLEWPRAVHEAIGPALRKGQGW
ncbi:MAG: DUF6708 domain-containing protein [Aquabacterium sp.]